jgi:hypothetical protein
MEHPWPAVRVCEVARRTTVIVWVAFGVVAGLLYPYGELAWTCREGHASSEACVWARAYFPLSRWVEPVIVTPIALGIAWVVARMADRRKRH